MNETPLDAQLAELNDASQPELVRRYVELTAGRQPPIRDRRWLSRRVAWHLQAKVRGSLSQPAMDRLLEIQRSLGLSFGKSGPTVRTKIAKPARHDHIAVGTTLRRTWRGREIEVVAREGGQYEWDGKLFPSLTAATRAITGIQWRPALFWGLVRRKRKP
jgi:hypothetical protein